MSDTLTKLVAQAAVESGLTPEVLNDATLPTSALPVPEEFTRALLPSEIEKTDPLDSEMEQEPEDTDKKKEVDLNDALYKIINDLTIPQKIKLALFGNQTARGLLIRDKNKVIPMFVLQNGKITENELFEFARNANLSDPVLRTIAGNPEWMKSYRMKFAVCSNPRMPIDVSMKWVKYLQKQDLRRLARSKNIPQVISNTARKLMEQ